MTEGQSQERPCDAAVPALRLQPEFTPGEKGHYALDELLGFHDREFVRNAHLALLRRPPTEAEMARHLDCLRSGRAGKVEIVENLLLSPEGRGQGVRVSGLRSPLSRRLGRAPVLGYLLRLVRGLSKLPVLMKHQQQFEAYSIARQEQIVEHVNSLAAEHARTRGVPQELFADLSETVMMLSDALAELSSGVAAVEARLDETAGALDEQRRALAAAREGQRKMFDELREERSREVGELREEQRAAEAAHQELIIQEQAVIVETQKAALADIQAQLDEVRRRHRELAALLPPHGTAAGPDVRAESDAGSRTESPATSPSEPDKRTPVSVAPSHERHHAG